MEYLRWILLLLGGVVLLLVYWVSRSRRNDKTTMYYQDNDNYSEPEEYLFDEIDQDPLLDKRGESPPPVKPKPPQPKPPQPTMGISEEDTHSPVISNISHELGTLNQLLTKKSRSPGKLITPVPVDEPGQDTFTLSAPTVTDDAQQPTLTPPEQPEKIVVLHVCARAGESLKGSDLSRLFTARNYTFGEMDIYHSCFQGKTIFSIVNMVEPGWFDPPTMDQFYTPGVSFFMRLPGPLAGDTAFEVLVSEARGMARELNAVVLDASRSTLTQQMEQHTREEIKQYDFQRKRGGI